ncbi:probable transcription factor At5g28040 [Dioscorea cayenensis subsp. rotundata]|uniref:Probable transcription factor At5g28040 n=1 Tax=Dioscorea cayennensis subsp. rotundata TaxID=55577 RepID=A0AB40BHB1_DIOCR|nr:probable transcription factor At5g28040 [Dioscorea cayenensis subsp. rotundata]
MASADDLGHGAFFDSCADDDSDSDDESFGPPPPPPSLVAAPTNPNPDGDLPTLSSDHQQGPLSDIDAFPSNALVASSFDDSRRLFQRLFSDEDEITILKGFREFVSQRGTTHASYQYDTGPFYDQIKEKLNLEFSKNQLVEKLRRLKKKYRTAVARIAAGRSSSFKSPHDREAFEISSQIWSPTFKRPRDQRAEAETNKVRIIDSKTLKANPIYATADVDHHREQKPIKSRGRPRDQSEPVEVAVVEGLPTPSMGNYNHGMGETVRSCVTPLFKELLNCVILGPSMAGGLIGGSPALSPCTPTSSLGGMDDKWRKQQIMELEVYAKEDGSCEGTD